MVKLVRPLRVCVMDDRGNLWTDTYSEFLPAGTILPVEDVSRGGELFTLRYDRPVPLVPLFGRAWDSYVAPVNTKPKGLFE